MNQDKDTHNPGKDKCEMLRALRRQIAERYGLEYRPQECHHEGDCLGTCPLCDKELHDLQRQLDERGITDIDLHTTQPESPQTVLPDERLCEDVYITAGMVPMPESEIGGLIDREYLYKQCYIAGLQFHEVEEIWPELYVGAHLALVRDRKNAHDDKAVAVVLASDYNGNPEEFDFDFILGYIPRTDNEDLARMLDEGAQMRARISELNPRATYARKIRIDIYLINPEEDEDNREDESRKPSDLLKVLSCKPTELNDFAETLHRKGHIHFRWGGFPPWERHLPLQGERVVMRFRREKDSVLYLMYTTATGMDCLPFLPEEDRTEVPQPDDSIDYVLTNIAGPVIIPNWSLDFMEEEPADLVQPDHFLSERASKKLEVLFKSII